MSARVTKDLLAGLLFIVIGGGTVLIAARYRFGNAEEMGPGYFPIMLGSILVLFGAIIAIRAYLHPAGSEPVATVRIRPLILVLIGVLAFGLLIRSYGLVAAILALLLVSLFATRERRTVLEIVTITVILVVMPILVFVYGLGMSFKIWPL